MTDIKQIDKGAWNKTKKWRTEEGGGGFEKKKKTNFTRET